MLDPRDVEISRLNAALADANAALERALDSRRHVEELQPAEGRSAASQRDLMRVIDATPALIWSAAPDGRTDSVNQYFVDYVGSTYEQLEADGWQSAIHPDDFPALTAIWDGLRVSGKQGQAEARLRRHDGEYRWFLMRASPVIDANGNVVRWYGVNTDIEDRKRAEEALASSERSLRQAIDTIPAIVFCNSAVGPNEFLSQRWHDYTGISSDAASGQGWQASLHPDDLPGMLKSWGAMLRTGAGGEVEGRMRRFDGTYRWFIFRTAALRDQDGNIVKWYGTANDIEDRKRAEIAVAANERNLRETIDAIPTLAWCNRTDGSNEFLNQRWHDYTGLTPAEANGWGWQVALHPEDLPGLLTKWTHMLSTGEPGELEARLRRRDGVYRWFLFRCDPLRDEAGNVARWYGTNTDIEDLKQAETELRRAYDSFADAQRLSHTGSFITDIVADDHNWSDEAYKIFEFDPGTRVSVARIRTVVHPEDLATFDSVIERGVAGLNVNFFFRIVTADGRLKHVHGIAHMLEEAAGRPLFVGALQDVTESKVAEDALRRSEAFLAQGEAVSKTGSFLWSPESGDFRWSQQLYRIFEFDPGSQVNLERIAERVHRQDHFLVRQMVERARSGLDSEYEIRFLMSDESVRYLHFVAKPALGSEHHPEYVGTVQDITERKLAEQERDRVRSELTHAARAMSLGVLTASLAHEVNQPLSGIITNANTCVRMLSSEPPNVKGALETAHRTIRDGNRASDVISRLRALYSKKEFAVERVDLSDVTREVLALSLHELQRHRVAVRTEFAPEGVEVVGDRVQIQQVILNLLLNACDAVKSMESGPRVIRIRTSLEPPGAGRLTVSDTGVGIVPGSSGKLFDPFYTTKPDGMGIGLSVSRSIIDRHRGRLWAEDNDGPGATFAFTIPAVGTV